MDISSLRIAVFDLDSWNLIPRPIDPRNLNLKSIIMIPEHDCSFSGNFKFKIKKMGRPKNFEKRKQIAIKMSVNINKYLISYRWIKFEKTDFSLFSIFGFLSPDCSHLRFKNVKLNSKFLILDLKLA